MTPVNARHVIEDQSQCDGDEKPDYRLVVEKAS
jgi:hypothetical protein